MDLGLRGKVVPAGEVIAARAFSIAGCTIPTDGDFVRGLL